jgi:hypothetical protein
MPQMHSIVQVGYGVHVLAAGAASRHRRATPAPPGPAPCRACSRSPSSKTENIPRPVPSRYSCEDVGLGIPDLAAPFLVWARIRIATYNLLPEVLSVSALQPHHTGRK